MYRLGIILKLVAARAACYIPVIGAVADIASVLRVFLDPDGTDYAAAGRAPVRAESVERDITPVYAAAYVDGPVD